MPQEFIALWFQEQLVKSYYPTGPQNKAIALQ